MINYSLSIVNINGMDLCLLARAVGVLFKKKKPAATYFPGKTQYHRRKRA